MLGFIILILIAWIIKTEIRLRKIFAGKKGSDLEDILASLVKDLGSLENTKNTMIADISEIERRLKKSIQGTEMIRFNPFKDAGSNQSFAIAMLNEHGDGIVISSMYARERMSVFAKPIKNFVSEYEMTEEEKEAVKKAKLSIKKPVLEDAKQ